MPALDIIQRRGSLARGLVAERSPDPTVAERGLQRMGVLLTALGNPHLAYRTIHIAGSKGKGTTAHAAAAILQEFGYATGRYTSPHLLTWNERIAVNSNSISDSAFDRLSGEVDRAMSEVEEQRPDLGSFNSFELLTAISFVHFRERRCDIAVIEVGLGGRFDSTNHVEPVSTVITRIESEHIEILGPTLRDVAWNKAGIVKPGIPVVVTEQQADVETVVASEAAARSAPLFREGREWSASVTPGRVHYRFGAEAVIEIESTLPGAHNAANIGAAVTAVRLVTDISPLPEATISRAIGNLVISGRFDRRSDPVTDRQLILDGAHTPESLATLVKTVVDETGAPQFPMIVGVLSDKPADLMLATLAPFAELIVFPGSSSIRAIPPGELQARATALGIRSDVAPSVRAALESIPAGRVPVVVTGSFGIVADCLRAITPLTEGVP